MLELLGEVVRILHADLGACLAHRVVLVPQQLLRPLHLAVEHIGQGRTRIVFIGGSIAKGFPGVGRNQSGEEGSVSDLITVTGVPVN